MTNGNSIEVTEDATSTSADEESRWILALFLLIQARGYKEAATDWEELLDCIQNGNRFFPKARVLDVIRERINDCVRIEPKGTILFRSRKTKPENTAIVRALENVANEYFDMLGMEENHPLRRCAWEDAIAFSTLFARSNDDIFTDLCEKQMADMNMGSFFGLDAAECDAPPRNRAEGGRANPEGMAYLYTSEDASTSIAEVRPSMGELVNVAEVELTRPVRLFDFSARSNCAEGKEQDAFASPNLEYYSLEFSKLNTGNRLDYLPTQYICEYLKSEGFDGIRYKSSLCQNGYNIALFDVNADTRGYKIISSNVAMVKECAINYESVDLSHLQHILPLELLDTDANIQSTREDTSGDEQM